jgi:prephenate dehydrogenase
LIRFKKVVIAGAGLMGASLALDIKKTKTAEHICALVRNKERAENIKQYGIFDSVTDSWHIALEFTDLIVLTTPVNTICMHLQYLEKYFNDHPDYNIPITDIGSVKERIYDYSRNLHTINGRFIGAHPLCGLEKRGIENAVQGLYKDAKCILTVGNNNINFKKIKFFWENVGCKISIMTPGEHDKILGYTSHLPHVLSFLLADIVPGNILLYSSTAFSDMTRIARSDSGLWKDIFLSNKKNIMKIILKYEESLRCFKKMMELENSDKLENYLKEINNKINKLSSN